MPYFAAMARTDIMKILFVCTGNICRSPLAERMLQNRSDELGLGLTVSSAGTRALNGHPMHPESQRVLRQRGLQPGDFVSRMLTESLAVDADYVLGMTREHRAFARQLAPVRWRRMFALREIGAMSTISATSNVGGAVNPTDERLDIADPIGQSAAAFDQAGAEIADSVDMLTEWISSQMLDRS